MLKNINGYYPEIVVPKAREWVPQLKQLAKAYIRALKLPLTPDAGVFFTMGIMQKIWLWWEARSALETMQTATTTNPLIRDS
jgi:hypothetical protein